MKLLKLITIAFIITPIASFASPNLEKIKSLSGLSGMAQYCQDYYERINSPFKHAVMRDYNEKISKKVVSLYTSKYEADTGHNYRQKAYIQYRDTFGKKPRKACKNLNGTLSALKLN